MVLRRASSNSFQVIGECYIHGLSNSVGVLGQLPDDWKTIIKGDALGRPTQMFANLRSDEETLEDPRLEPLPQSWKRATYDRRADNPAIFERFGNLKTGELANHDPRLSPKALKARGVNIQLFRLV
ncbi:heterokaryon incompatibility protein [Phlyctema vagabunda]|uniref:Heterokaryon incompatibility protein n=1 Tax=Phlyctema vagabunda TaxID=108571 RepID=A0ABR4P601_9HELO